MPKFENNKKIISLVIGVALLVLFVVYLYPYFSGRINNGKSLVQLPYVSTYDKAMDKIVTDGDPAPLQKYFLESVKSGKKDDSVKSAIYWITHRYFDNGGDVAEIYTYIDANKELQFINEIAKAQYPDIFLKVKDGSIKKYSVESTLALMAYYDAIDSRGYANFAMWGLAANKYAELAFNAKRDESLSKNDRVLFEASYRQSSYTYVQKIDNYLKVTTDKTRSLDDLHKTDVSDSDILVGLNQYVSAIAYLESLGLTTGHPFKTTDIYEFINSLAESKVGRLYFFSNYLYATTLIVSQNADNESVKIPLERAVAYAQSKKDDPVLRPKGSIRRVIDSKINGEPSIFSYDNAKELASLSPVFKEWLKTQGWKDSDF